MTMPYNRHLPPHMTNLKTVIPLFIDTPTIKLTIELDHVYWHRRQSSVKQSTNMYLGHSPGQKSPYFELKEKLKDAEKSKMKMKLLPNCR